MLNDFLGFNFTTFQVTAVSKCSKCDMTVSKQEMKSHECVAIKSEIESAGKKVKSKRYSNSDCVLFCTDDGENIEAIEFLESDYEGWFHLFHLTSDNFLFISVYDDSSDDELTGELFVESYGIGVNFL